MGDLNFCLFSDVFHTVSGQLLSDIAADSGIPFLITRLLHNKPLYLWFNFLHCYFLYSDIRQILAHVSIIAFPFVLYALLAKPRFKLLLLIQIMMPFFFMLNPSRGDLAIRISQFQWYYEVMAVIGVIKFLWREKLR